MYNNRSRSSSRSPFRNVSQEQYDLVNNTNESEVERAEKAKASERRARAGDLLTEVTRGMAITQEGFNSNKKSGKPSAVNNRKT